MAGLHRGSLRWRALIAECRRFSAGPSAHGTPGSGPLGRLILVHGREAPEEKWKKRADEREVRGENEKLEGRKGTRGEPAAGTIGGRTAPLRVKLREAGRATEAKIAQSVERHKQAMKALRR
jgi:hypothetical protein